MTTVMFYMDMHNLCWETVQFNKGTQELLSLMFNQLPYDKWIKLVRFFDSGD